MLPLIQVLAVCPWEQAALLVSQLRLPVRSDSVLHQFWARGQLAQPS